MATEKKAPRFSRKSAEDRKQDLVEAGLACLAQGGITSFTVDNICREAKVSKGLVVHHFGSKEGLAAAVYAAAFDRMLSPIFSDEETGGNITRLLNWLLDAVPANQENLRIWLALWGEMSGNQQLQAEHRKHYELYREWVARTINVVARKRGLAVDGSEIAASLMAIVDGVWLQQCLDPTRLKFDEAMAICERLVENALAAGTPIVSPRSPR